MSDTRTLLSRSALVILAGLFLAAATPASACKVIRYKDGEALCHTDNGHGSSSKKKKDSGVPASVTAGFVEALNGPKKRTWRDRFNNPTWRERFSQRNN